MLKLKMVPVRSVLEPCSSKVQGIGDRPCKKFALSTHQWYNLEKFMEFY